MILVKLMGGLGNQMFQYAAAKSLACRHNVDVKVDLSFLKLDTKGNYTPRKYELDIFNSHIKIATDEDVKNFTKKVNTKYSRLLQRKFPLFYNSLYAVEKGSSYHPEFKNYPKNTYLDGFWQSELYFKKYELQLKKEFTFKNTLPKQLESYLIKIQTTNSVSIHVRRGDYVTLKSANEFHGSCSLQYYKSALEIILNTNSKVDLFVFSDDIDWCRQNFNFKFPLHFIEHNFEAHWDMFLMSYCKHNIIANSSFSWWGAWLNNNENKIVVMPKYWFKNIESKLINIKPNNWLEA